MKHNISINFTYTLMSYSVPVKTVTGTIEEARAWIAGYIDCMCDHGKWARHGIGQAINIEVGILYSFTIETE